MVPVSSRHALYVERSGKKGGYPIFFLHGGPGSQSRALHRRYFDPDFFDIVLFDQRGCGRSVPAGETRENDTAVLVEDINAIRNALEITGKFSLLGGSWGSTLALAYALHYPQWLDELILRGVFLGTDEELNWFTHGLSGFAPEAWTQLVSGRDSDIVDDYYQVVQDLDDRHAGEAARRWAEYEMQIMRIGSALQEQMSSTSPTTPTSPTTTSMPSISAILDSARVQLHFLKHKCFLAQSPLLEAAHNIYQQVTIVQGRFDLVCPPITAWRLSQRLPRARLRMVENGGHSASSGSMAWALREEVDALRDRLTARLAGAAQ